MFHRDNNPLLNWTPPVCLEQSLLLHVGPSLTAFPLATVPSSRAKVRPAGALFDEIPAPAPLSSVSVSVVVSVVVAVAAAVEVYILFLERTPSLQIGD